MLVSFSTKNWMSYRDTTTLTMVASRERQHNHRVARISSLRARVLPAATIMGGNGSGKTNLLKALSFTQNLVLNASLPGKPIPVVPFAFRANNKLVPDEPTEFTFEIIVEKEAYEYFFSVTHERVVEERLIRITGSTEREIFSRNNQDVTISPDSVDKESLTFLTRALAKNQLFLTQGAYQNIATFLPVYNWFKDTLVLVAPDSRFAPFQRFFDDEATLLAAFESVLPKLDTGIIRLDVVDVPISQISLPNHILQLLESQVSEGEVVRLLNVPSPDRLLVTRQNGVLMGKHLVAIHAVSPGVAGELSTGEEPEEVGLQLGAESDGIQRMVELLPVFLSLTNPDVTKVFAIDEIDRSIHTSITRELLSIFLEACSAESRVQLICTTHDTMLLDQRLLRRDEIWFTELQHDGSTALIALADYQDVRYDKDIRKSYLQGRFGGLPKTWLPNRFVPLRDTS